MQDRNWTDQSAGFVEGLLKPWLSTPAGLEGQVDAGYAIYRNNVTVGLIDALGANFSAIRGMLGAPQFMIIARNFIQSHPPSGPVMYEYGDKFPAYIKASEAFAAWPFAEDVAKLEWLFLKSYHAADDGVLSPQELTRTNPQMLANLRFKPHPAVHMMSSGYSAATIMSALRAGGDIANCETSVPQHIVLTRPKWDVQVHVVDAATYALFGSLLSGRNFAAAVDETAEVHAELDLAHAVECALNSGIFATLESDEA